MKKQKILERKDFRKVYTITIDPKNAKDFDDAISFKRTKKGNYEIGIHIADVSHYVRPGSHEDMMAREKTTSVYLADKVIHMLPESLSENLCSLKEKEDKLTFSVIFELDENANILKREIFKTMINVDASLTYEQAQNIIDGNNKVVKNRYGKLVRDGSKLQDALNSLLKISKKLNKKRRRNGSINFKTKEIEFIFDSNKNIKDAKIKQTLPAMDMIEDLMLLANKEIATFISQKCAKNKNCHGIYRIHDKPGIKAMTELNLFLKTIGIQMRINKQGFVHPKEINKILREVENTPYEKTVNTAILRAMSKAEYSHKNIGHFSLAFDNYTHFTSPIRRYPDIMVHRIVECLLLGKIPDKHELKEYRKLAKKSTEKEIEAMQMERESVKQALVKLFENKIGQVFTGEITGITDFGVFITETKTGAEGLTHITQLPVKDYYDFNPRSLQLIGRNTNTRFTLGQKLKIRLEKADTTTDKISWKILDM